MKHYIISLLFVLITTLVYCQQESGYVGIRGGVVAPYQELGAGISTEYNGFVSTGGQLVIEGSYFYSSNIGVGALISGNILCVDEKAYAHQFMKNNCLYSDVTVDSEYYYTSSFAGGLCFRAPINQTIITLTGKLMAGVFWVRTPNILFNYHYSNVASLSVFQKTENQSNFVIYYSLGSNFQVWDKVGLNVNLDYVGSKFEFHLNTLEGERLTYRHISHIGFTFGAYYQL